MGVSLYWQPVSKTSKDLPDQLKHVLTKRYEDIGRRGRVFGTSDLEFLSGLAFAGVDGAQDLISAIEQHDEVKVWLE